jgi:hypothetical protein
VAGLVRAAIRGRLSEFLREEVRATSAAMRRAVDRAGRDVQGLLRAQVRAAGFRSSRALENAWRLKVFPAPGVVTLRPAASIQSAAPNLHDAFDRGATITVRRGGKFLAIPTGFNATGGRRNASGRGGLRVTPAQMVRQPKGQAFVAPLGRAKGGNALWCLRVAQATAIGRRRGRRALLFAAGSIEVATGRGGGRRATGGTRARRTEVVRQILERGFVPMFVLLRVVKLRKRLSIAQVERAAGGILARRIVESLSQG